MKSFFHKFHIRVPVILTTDFKVVQYWNGVANENKKIAMAVRANNEIIMCTWIHSDTGDEYRLVSTIKHNILYENPA